ncbi:ComEC/Rec2 family competence protein [Nonlabens marinus]|uniref:Competence protein n=1 Tax=Nonlabens marinus S1-08 TaxID=1454201 RepID=W8VQ42_9FLAO|nr:ComEC/Rec2 family competence protein [Nonlabens marinus]BAO55439.1 competence protein [Nonlabens marinus S1-08]
MRWLDYPFYRILIAFIAGICIARFSQVSDTVFFTVSGLALILAVASYFFFPFKTFSKVLFTNAIIVFFIGIGGLLFHFKTEYLPSDHYESLQHDDQDAVITLELTDQLSSNEYNNRFYAQIKQINRQPATGRILVLFKSSDSLYFQVGDRLTVYDDINDASDGRNPGDFNYKEYLESIDVYGQVYVDKPRILNISRQQAQLSWYIGMRNQLLKDLQGTELQAQPRALIEALVLGQRQNVDPTVSQNFRDAGVIHILALSGLHVGIMLLILQFCLRWMLRFKYGKLLQSLLIIALLWSFALLTGMSPSIMRAVMMFSFVAVGMNINRKGSVFHSLTISALVLLLIDPRMLFQVGFQLSYTAVLAIVLLQPIFSSFVARPKSWFVRNLWQIFTVTLSAQIGVAPLSIYYFHQFPLLFLVGNMVLLFVLPAILILSIAFITIVELDISSGLFAEGLNFIFNLIIDLVSWISNFKFFILKDLYVTVVEVLLLYLILLGVALYLRPQLVKSKRERLRMVKPNNFLHFSLICVAVLLGYGIYKNVQVKESFLVLHQSRGTAIALSKGNDAQLFLHMPSMKADRKIESIRRLKNTGTMIDREVAIDSLPSMLEFAGKSIIVIDESTIYDPNLKNVEVLLLSNSPKVNLDRLITDLQPQLIIADGSNYRNMVHRWQQTCKGRDVNFINTYEYGAVSLLDH